MPIQIQYLILMHFYLGQVMRVNPTLYVICHLALAVKGTAYFINEIKSKQFHDPRLMDRVRLILTDRVN